MNIGKLVKTSLTRTAIAGLAAFVMSCAHQEQLRPGKHDLDGDGRIETTITMDDYDGDGKKDDLQSTTYDEQGNITNKVWDYNKDNVVDKMWHGEFNAENRLVREQLWEYLSKGMWKRTHTHYDAAGNKKAIIIDKDGDNSADEVWHWTYDARNNRTKEEHDTTGDGKPEHIHLWGYDQDDNLVSEGTGNMTTGDVWSWLYDTRGNKLVEQHDTDGDGKFESVHMWKYDKNDNLTGEAIDEDGDGSFERIWTPSKGWLSEQ